MSKLNGDKLQREDIDEMEKELGKCEIALNRIKEFPNLFSFTEEKIGEYVTKYNNLTTNVTEINMRRISWN